VSHENLAISLTNNSIDLSKITNIIDSDGNTGEANQVLVMTASGIKWKNAKSGTLPGNITFY